VSERFGSLAAAITRCAFGSTPTRSPRAGLTAGDVVRAIQEQNLQVSAGQLGAEPIKGGADFLIAINAQGRLRSTRVPQVVPRTRQHVSIPLRCPICWACAASASRSAPRTGRRFPSSRPARPQRSAPMISSSTSFSSLFAWKGPNDLRAASWRRGQTVVGDEMSSRRISRLSLNRAGGRRPEHYLPCRDLLCRAAAARRSRPPGIRHGFSPPNLAQARFVVHSPPSDRLPSREPVATTVHRLAYRSPPTTLRIKSWRGHILVEEALMEGHVPAPASLARR